MVVDVVVIVRFVFVIALERVGGHAVDTHHLLVGVLRSHPFTRVHADASSGGKREESTRGSEREKHRIKGELTPAVALYGSLTKERAPR